MTVLSPLMRHSDMASGVVILGLSAEGVEKYLKAGKIASDIKRVLWSIVTPGKSYLEVCNTIEEEIRRRGGQPAFPCNISVAHEAAHYSPLADDNRVIPESGIVKIDFGVSVDGYLSDTAVSIDLSGEHEDLVKAVEEALDRAIEAIAPGIKVSLIGEVIERTLSSYGVRPVRNLTGHAMSRYRLHTGLSIPNTRGMFRGRIEKGMAIAIEPFGTKGIGYVLDSDIVTIYSVVRPPHKKMKLGDKLAEDLYKRVYNERKELPFSERWYVDDYGIENVRRALKVLCSRRIVTCYPTLIEASGAQVAQAEDSVLVTDKEVIVYTRL